MQAARIGILGAGLSGLYAAFLLEQKGIKDYVLLEARDNLGGRIASVSTTGNMSPRIAATKDINRFDLGPAWFWPELQPQLDQLVRDLGLEYFQQHEKGHMVVERSAYEHPMRTRGYVNSPASMRLVGGMGALIDALHHSLDPERIITGQIVRRLRRSDGHVEIDSEDSFGRVTTRQVEHVLLAIPPRLVEKAIEFTPALPQTLTKQWHTTATWMAPHAKYVAIYDTPFWREQGLSGEARSMCGPLGEIHDASMPGGSAALFGFFGIPARTRKSMSKDILQSRCREQFVRLFGPQAATPKAEFIKDWAMAPYTATAADLDDAGQHAQPPAVRAQSGPWSACMTGIASEWSQQFPGYVAGAIDAASKGVQALPE
jgi:monoamine oxidase